MAILTIGQYLRPSADHAPMTRYYHPDEFADLKRIALGLGLRARRSRTARAQFVPRARTGRCGRAGGRDPLRRAAAARPARCDTIRGIPTMTRLVLRCSSARRSSPRRRAAARTPAPATRRADATLVAGTNTAIGHMGRYDFQAAVDVLDAAWRRSLRPRPRPPSTSPSRSSTASAPTTRRRPNAGCARWSIVRPSARGPRYALGLLLLYQGRDAEAFPLLSGVAAAAPGRSLPRLLRRPGAPGRRARRGADVVRAGARHRSAAAQRLLRRRSRPCSGSGRAAEAQRPRSNASRRSTPTRARAWRSSSTRAWGRWPRPCSSARAGRADAGAAGPALRARGRAARAAAARGRPAASPISVADLDGDGALDLFVAGAGTGAARISCCVGRARLGRRRPAHPLAAVTDVRAALWGDLDNDGATDVVLVRGGRQHGRLAADGRPTSGRTSRPRAARRRPASTPSTARSSTPITTAISTSG